MMKLVYVCRSCSLLGGLSRIAWEIAIRAAREAHEVHLVARRLPRDIAQTPIRPHRVFQLPALVGGEWRFRSFAHFASRRAEALSGSTGIIHGFGDNYAAHILTLGNVDWTYPAYIPGRRPDRTAIFIKKRAFSHPTLRRLVLLSHQMRRDLLDLMPDFDQSRIRLIYPGVDPDRFSRHSRAEVRRRLTSERGIPEGDFWIVLAAGGDFEKRNVATLAKALQRLRYPNWRLLLLGASRGAFPWPADLEARSHFLGRMDDIGTVLPGCDLLAYPAWYDEASLVCFEAMASGLPLIVSRTVGASEVLGPANKAFGVLEDPGDADKLARRIEGMMSDEPLRRRMSEENRTEAGRYSWEKVYEQYREIYLELSREGAARTGPGGPDLA